MNILFAFKFNLLWIIWNSIICLHTAGPKFEGYEQPVIQNLNSNQNSNNPVQPPSVSVEMIKPDLTDNTANSEKEGEGVKSHEPIQIQEQKHESLGDKLNKSGQVRIHILVFNSTHICLYIKINFIDSWRKCFYFW